MCSCTSYHTIHDDSLISKSQWKKGVGGQQVIQKSSKYNSFMGGVDKAGQLLQYYDCHIVSKKWWKRVIFHMLDVTLVNAYILYYTSATGKPMSHLDFRISVARGLVTAGDSEIPDSASTIVGALGLCDCWGVTISPNQLEVHVCRTASYAATGKVEIENVPATDAVAAKLPYACTHVSASIIL